MILYYLQTKINTQACHLKPSCLSNYWPQILRPLAILNCLESLTQLTLFPAFLLLQTLYPDDEIKFSLSTLLTKSYFENSPWTLLGSPQVVLDFISFHKHTRTHTDRQTHTRTCAPIASRFKLLSYIPLYYIYFEKTSGSSDKENRDPFWPWGPTDGCLQHFHCMSV